MIVRLKSSVDEHKVSDLSEKGTKHSVIVVEVKTTLKVEDVNDFIIEKLSRFFEFFPKYKGPDSRDPAKREMKLYGAVAGIKIEESADRYAYRKGLFVLTLSGSPREIIAIEHGCSKSYISRGEGMVVILNDEKFKPKQW
jgi:hypothetical protein